MSKIAPPQTPTTGSDPESAWIVTPDGTVQVNMAKTADGWEIDIHDPTASATVTLNLVKLTS